RPAVQAGRQRAADVLQAQERPGRTAPAPASSPPGGGSRPALHGEARRGGWRMSDEQQAHSAPTPDERGNVIGLLDRATADSLASQAPDPTPASLDTRTATRGRTGRGLRMRSVTLSARPRRA